MVEINSLFCELVGETPALNFCGLFSLAANTNGGQETLRKLCAETGVSFDDVMLEASGPRPDSTPATRETIDVDFFPLMNKVLRIFRKDDSYQQLVLDKMTLGAQQMQELGNMYSGALPAWFAAGLEEAAEKSLPLAGKEILLIGYGSGDAAEIIPVHMVEGWQEAAKQIGVREAMDNAIDLSQEQYAALRRGDSEKLLSFQPNAEFIIDHIGTQNEVGFHDTGIEYYRYIA